MLNIAQVISMLFHDMLSSSPNQPNTTPNIYLMIKKLAVVRTISMIVARRLFSVFFVFDLMAQRLVQYILTHKVNVLAWILQIFLCVKGYTTTMKWPQKFLSKLLGSIHIFSRVPYSSASLLGSLNSVKPAFTRMLYHAKHFFISETCTRSRSYSGSTLANSATILSADSLWEIASLPSV